MADTVLFGNSMSDFSSQKEDHMFVQKELQYISDNNNKNFSRNQIDFDTITLSNNGRWVDYQNGYITVPCSIALNSDSVATVDDAMNAIRMKNDLALIDSVSVIYNNSTMVQESSEFVSYPIFNQHTHLGQDDLNRADLYGYAKDSPAYGFNAGAGLVNSSSVSAHSTRLQSPWQTEVAGVLSTKDIENSGGNYANKAGNTTTFRYNAKIMLKDLPFFGKLPLLKGSNIRLTLRLNQGSVTTTTTAGGVSTVVPNLKGSAFPVMRLDCPVDSVETITFDVVETCRLYVPVYQMADSFESQYLSLGTKKVVYDDLYINHIRLKQKGAFHNLITNGLSRTKRLIVVPMLGKSTNTSGVLPTESPLCSAPATVSPYYARLNVKISGRNVYPQNVEYKYEHFTNELNGKYSENGGMIRGASSGLISFKDYQSTYGYFVVDLSRRHAEDDNTPLSLELFGDVQSAIMDFLCIVEYEKDCMINVSTGQLLSA